MVKNKLNLISIDIIRAIAALGVYIRHSGIGYLIYKYLNIPYAKNIDKFGALYAVPLFFLISGYCIHLSNLKYIKNQEPLPIIVYYKRRFLRIFPAYIFAVIISISVNYFTGTQKNPTMWDTIIHLFCLQGFTVSYFNTINLVLWTITVEIAFYIIYPIFYYLRLKYNLNVAIITILFISTLNIIYFSVQQNIQINAFYWVGNIWFSWCAGAYIADKLYFDANSLNKTPFKIIYLFITIIFITSAYTNFTYIPILGYQFKILIWTGPLIFIISKEKWLQTHNNFFIKILTYIGLSSYSLYLLHEPLIMLKNYLVHAYLPKSIQMSILILGIFLIPVVTWLSYIYIEKPFIKNKILPKS